MDAEESTRIANVIHETIMEIRLAEAEDKHFEYNALALQESYVPFTQEEEEIFEAFYPRS